MKKREHRIQLRKFRDQHITQSYYHKQEVAGVSYLVMIMEMSEQLNGKWLLTLEDNSKTILTDQDFIYYIKKEREE